MKGLWYGDRRDRVKWGALLHLARTRTQGARHVVQVAYFRDGESPTLITDVGVVDLPREAWDHFSDLKQIARLSEASRVPVHVFDNEFVPARRREYVDAAIAYLRGIAAPRVVFLDPDTGLGVDAEHVTARDLTQFWEALSSGDILALYQHADRSKTWQTKRVTAFSEACETVSVAAITSPVAGDVAILWCKKA